MSKIFMLAGSLFGALGVMIGAFGAHALKTILEAHQRVDTFETAVRYHFIHAIVLLVLGLLMTRTDSRWFVYSGYGFILGILIFSGSLYVLSLSGVSKWGALAPIGGLAFILGWLSMFIGIFKSF